MGWAWDSWSRAAGTFRLLGIRGMLLNTHVSTTTSETTGDSGQGFIRCYDNMVTQSARSIPTPRIRSQCPNRCPRPHDPKQSPTPGSEALSQVRRNLGQRLLPRSRARAAESRVRIAVGLRLGAPLVPPPHLHLRLHVTPDGRHGLACRKSAGRHSRHSQVNDLLLRAFIGPGCRATREPQGLCGARESVRMGSRLYHGYEDGAWPGTPHVPTRLRLLISRQAAWQRGQ